jgi:uncharacterized protein
MLRVDLQAIERVPVATTGTIAADDPALDGVRIRLRGPVGVVGEVRATDGGDYRWRGHIRAEIDGECRRCLGDVTLAVDDDVDVLFSSDPDLIEDPTVYALAPEEHVLDVTVAVREELVLRAENFPLCRSDCRGLCAGCGADLNAGPCACPPAGTNH